MKAIAAVSENWGIGRDNSLLFHISEDMKFFRRSTADSVVIMGRKTLDSFPGGKPLPKRVNIVLTHNEKYYKDGVVAVHSVKEAVEEAQSYGKEIFVIGGADIYAQLLDMCDKCLITKVSACPEADSFFPNLDSMEEWEAVCDSGPKEENGLEFRFVTYKKR